MSAGPDIISLPRGIARYTTHHHPMALKLLEESMPLTRRIARELALPDSNAIIIQHGVSDAIDFAVALREGSGADVLFLPKPFSQNRAALELGASQ